MISTKLAGASLRISNSIDLISREFDEKDSDLTSFHHL